MGPEKLTRRARSAPPALARQPEPAAKSAPIPLAAGTAPRSHAARAIQRSVGNARLGRIAGVPVQAKLTVGAPGDVYEQEADHVAEQVMSGPQAQLQRAYARGGGGPDKQSSPALMSSRLIQRSPLSDEMEQLWTVQGSEAFFQRLAELQVSDTDVARFIEEHLRGDDLRRARAIYHLPVVDNDVAALERLPLVQLFQMYTTQSPRFEPPELGGIGYTLDWIFSSAGSGHIRHVIRTKLEQQLQTSDPASLRQTVDIIMLGVTGPAERRQELRRIAEDVAQAPGWRATDQIPIHERMSALDRGYAELWNSKGQLFTDLAHSIDPRIPPYVTAGIMAAETGQTFFRQGRAIARFEAHVFRQRWGNTSQARRRVFQQHFRSTRPHRWRRGTTGPFQGYHGNQDREWEVLDFARSLDALADTAAIESTSFGAGQTMGFNYSRVGFASAHELLSHYQTSERAQVAGIFNYIDTIRPVARRTRVINAIVQGNFLPLSQAYGPRDPTGHAQRITRAVRRMRRLVEAARRSASETPGTTPAPQ